MKHTKNRIFSLAVLLALILSSTLGSAQAASAQTAQAPVLRAAAGTQEIIQITGLVQAFSETSITVMDNASQVYDIAITPETVIVGDVEVGMTVCVAAVEDVDGLVAIRIEVVDDPAGPPGTVFISGVVDVYTDTLITVTDDFSQTFDIAITPATVIVGDIQVGVYVYVMAEEGEGGALTAIRIEVCDDPQPPNTFSVFGEVLAYTETQITVQDVSGEVYDIAITPDTVIVGDIEVGCNVYVEVEVVDGKCTYRALYIEVCDDPIQPPNTFPVFGVVQAYTDTQITVVDNTGRVYDIAITPDTVIVGEIEVGCHVYVEVYAEGKCILTAVYIEVIEDPGPPSNIFPIFGVVEAYTDTQITVADDFSQTFAMTITPDTVIVGDVQVGMYVYVEALVGENGLLTALYIEVIDPRNIVTIIGEVEAYTDTLIVVDGQSILITPDTVIVGEVEVGSYVFIDALSEEKCLLTALYIEVIDDPVQPPDIYPIVGVVQAYTDTLITVMDDSGEVYDIAIISNTVIVTDVEVGDFVYVEVQESPAGLLTALYIEVLDCRVIGIVTNISNSAILVNGQTLGISAQTMFVGSVTVGTRIVARAAQNLDGTLKALYIKETPQASFTLFLPAVSQP